MLVTKFKSSRLFTVEGQSQRNKEKNTIIIIPKTHGVRSPKILKRFSKLLGDVDLQKSESFPIYDLLHVSN